MNYPITEQLERIYEEIEGFSLYKPAEEMTDAELEEAKKEASKYVEWVEDEDYEEPVPKVKRTGRIIYPI